MALPPLDSEVTAAWHGRLWRLKASGPSFKHGNGDVSFPTYESGLVGDTVWLYANDEDVTWKRGQVDEESPEAKALLAAEALR